MADQELVELLKKNNDLLEQMLKMQKKEQKAQKWRTAFHIFMNLLPFILLALAGWYVFDLVNQNIQALQGNVDALKEFVVGIVPDFSGVGDTLNDVWQDVGELNPF
jgi:hypothetical protein